MEEQTKKLGAYTLLTRLNEGGTAEVYLAAAPMSGGRKRLVAIKRILPELARERDFARMLIDEARLACQLAHAGIARVVDLGHEDGELFLAVEYVPGMDLSDIAKALNASGRLLDPALVCHVGVHLLDALSYAHDAKDAAGHPMQIVHRDVSPSNVLVSWDGEVKVIDFGIARATNRLTKTQAGVLKGKFRYMSPEQASGMSIDRRADVYAAAVVMHELLAGERLFAGTSGFALIQKVIDGKTPTLRGRPGVSDELAEIIERGLACVRENRWPTADAFAEALRGHLARATQGRDLSAELSAFMKSTFAAEHRHETQTVERLLEAAELGSELVLDEPGEQTVIRSRVADEATAVRPAPKRIRSSRSPRRMAEPTMILQREESAESGKKANTALKTAGVVGVVAVVLAAVYLWL